MLDPSALALRVCAHGNTLYALGTDAPHVDDARDLSHSRIPLPRTAPTHGGYAAAAARSSSAASTTSSCVLGETFGITAATRPSASIT